MIWLYEAAAMAALGGVIWILFRAAHECPDQPGMRHAARAGLAVWVVFSLLMLMRAGVFDDPAALLVNLLIVAAIVAVILGYRRVLIALRDRHDKH